MKFLNLTVCFICLANILQAQTTITGARFTSLANSGVALQDIWSLQSNPAGLAIIKRPAAAFSGENKFMSSGVSTQAALFAFPYHGNVFGVSIRNYGIEEYREQQAEFAYSRSFGETVFAAISINLHQVKISRYGEAGAWSADAGIQYKASDNLIIGAHISNPGQSSFNSDLNVTIPVCFEFGGSMRVTDNVLLASSLVKELQSVADIRCGIEYNTNGKIFLRGGFSSHPFCQYAGFGTRYHSFFIDVSVASHPDLGYSPQLSLKYDF